MARITMKGCYRHFRVVFNASYTKDHKLTDKYYIIISGKTQSDFSVVSVTWYITSVLTAVASMAYTYYSILKITVKM